MSPSETPPSETQIAIAGAGIGGLCAALSLAQRGIQSVIFERAPALAEVGAGLQLSPNAMRVLDRLGLSKQVHAVASAPEAARIRRATDQRLLLHMPLGDAATQRWGAPYLQIHRADLQRILIDAVTASDQAELRLGEPVADIATNGTLRLESGHRVGTQAAVIADGIRSGLRHVVSPKDGFPVPSGDIAWRALVPVTDLPFSISDQTGVWTAPRRHFVHYPVRGGALINLVGVSEATHPVPESWNEPGDPAEFASLFGQWPEPVASLARAASAVGCWALHHRPPARCLARGRLALLGDAAHPVLPFMAQGAAMAIEDGFALAEALITNGSIETRLSRYESSRLARVRHVQRASTRNARLFHLPDRLAAAAFGGAQILNRGDHRRNMRRLDWLYGGGPRLPHSCETSD